MGVAKMISLPLYLQKPFLEKVTRKVEGRGGQNYPKICTRGLWMAPSTAHQKCTTLKEENVL